MNLPRITVIISSFHYNLASSTSINNTKSNSIKRQRNNWNSHHKNMLIGQAEPTSTSFSTLIISVHRQLVRLCDDLFLRHMNLIIQTMYLKFELYYADLYNPILCACDSDHSHRNQLSSASFQINRFSIYRKIYILLFQSNCVRPIKSIVNLN